MPILDRGERAREDARRGAIGLSWVFTAGAIVAMALDRLSHVPLTSLWLGVCALSAACLGSLFAVRRLPRPVILGLLSVQTLAVLLAVSLDVHAFALSGRPFSPFSVTKMVAIVVALFCPSTSLGIVLVGLTVAQPFVLLAVWGTAMQGRIPDVEPWQTVAIAVGSLVFLRARQRHAVLGAELARMEAEKRWFEGVAWFALWVRDQSQVPLARLSRSFAQLRTQDQTSHVVLRCENAVATYGGFSMILGGIKRHILMDLIL